MTVHGKYDGSGNLIPLYMSEVNAEFKRGDTFGHYYNTNWYKDDNSSGTFNTTPMYMGNFYDKSGTPPTVTADYMIVGGGAGGGGSTINWGGVGHGGGGGMVITGTAALNTRISYSLTVGAGGAGSTGWAGSDGNDSSFLNITATAGWGTSYPWSTWGVNNPSVAGGPTGSSAQFGKKAGVNGDWGSFQNSIAAIGSPSGWRAYQGDLDETKALYFKTPGWYLITISGDGSDNFISIDGAESPVGEQNPTMYAGSFYQGYEAFHWRWIPTAGWRNVRARCIRNGVIDGIAFTICCAGWESGPFSRIPNDATVYKYGADGNNGYHSPDPGRNGGFALGEGGHGNVWSNKGGDGGSGCVRVRYPGSVRFSGGEYTYSMDGYTYHTWGTPGNYTLGTASLPPVITPPSPAVEFVTSSRGQNLGAYGGQAGWGHFDIQGHQAGDLLIAIIAAKAQLEDPEIINSSSGWTKLTSVTNTSTNADADHRIGVIYTKIADGQTIEYMTYRQTFQETGSPYSSSTTAFSTVMAFRNATGVGAKTVRNTTTTVPTGPFNTVHSIPSLTLNRTNGTSAVVLMSYTASITSGDGFQTAAGALYTTSTAVAPSGSYVTSSNIPDTCIILEVLN